LALWITQGEYMRFLFIFNHQPYDGSDVAWNGLRLATNLQKRGEEVRIFLMNDAVDLARDSTKKPDFYDHDLVETVKNLYKNGAKLKVCGTCMARCGINKNEPYFDEAIKGTMDNLVEWSLECEKILTF